MEARVNIGRVTFNESFAAIGTGTSLRWDRVICCETWTNESKFVLIGNFALIFKNERDIYIYMQGLGKGWVQYEDHSAGLIQFSKCLRFSATLSVPGFLWEKRLSYKFSVIYQDFWGLFKKKKESPCTCHPLKVGKNGIPMTVPSGANFKSPNIFFTVTSACSAVELPWTAFWRIFLP